MPCIRRYSSEPSRGRKSAARAFSLIEVMIAIVLLGFGLVMVATMYPIAWNRARIMTEQSMTGSVTASAEVLLRRVLQVDGGKVIASSTAEYPDRGSFAGDMIFYTDKAGNPTILYAGDTRVHALHMENILVAPKSGPRRFFPDRLNPDREVTLPFRLEQLRPAYIPGEETGLLPVFYKYCFGAAQIRFEDRLYPPLPPRTNTDARGVFLGDDESWDDALDTRRFAYAVLHRQRGYERKYADLPRFAERIVGPDGYFPPPCMATDTPLDLAVREADFSRSFDFYMVTLRRSQASYRFAQQDPSTRLTPDPTNRGKAVTVQALPPDSDVVLPVPWRVQIYIPQPPQGAAIPYRDLSYAPSFVSKPAPATGTPTVVHVNDAQFPAAPFVIDLFQEGTWFIDEHNGQIYQVRQRRLVANPSGGDRAILTLDREITVEDIDDHCECQAGGPYPGACVPNHIVEPAFEGTETLRSVWVFPPPVQGRLLNGDPFFEGDSPVIAIDVRTLTFAPRP